MNPKPIYQASRAAPADRLASSQRHSENVAILHTARHPLPPAGDSWCRTA